MSQELMSVEGQLVGMPLAGPESFSQQQLDYLKRALGVDETVLWEGALGPGSSTTLSETIANFEAVEIFGYTDDGTTFPWSVKVATRGQSALNIGTVTTNNGWAKFLYMTISSGTTLAGVISRALTWGSGGWSGDSGLTGWRITKVVGIKRIAGGN